MTSDDDSELPASGMNNYVQACRSLRAQGLPIDRVERELQPCARP